MSFLASLAGLIGYFLIYVDKYHQNRVVVRCLSFASGIMIGISIFDLLPNSFKNINFNNHIIETLLILIFLCVGIILSTFLNKHLSNNNESLYRVGVMSFLAIMFHNIPEGIITFASTQNNVIIGTKLALAMALHNIPEGICIAVPIYYSTKSKKKAFLYVFLGSFSEFFGSVITYLLLLKYINNNVMSLLYALIAGIMINISIYELIPEAYNKSSLKPVFKWFLMGLSVIIITIFIK